MTMNNYTLTLNSAPDNSNSLKVDLLNVKKASLVLRAINHKLRQEILQLIHKAGKITVTELYHKLNLEQSVTSQHLAILRKANFVTTERNRRFIFYRVNYEALKFIEEESRKLLS